MQRSASLSKYLNPWKFRREEAARQQRVADLRKRDGDNCQRCRRPLRFELPSGHDQAPRFYELAPASGEGLLPPIERQVLVHVRCNAAGADNTAEVTERVRRKTEAALFSKNRKRA
ncbi:MAG TPA: hypothetical protein VE968_08785 [Sphingomicrobium sp.]|nr:hypothetical protein [Sphingomicrobium sp.]